MSRTSTNESLLTVTTFVARSILLPDHSLNIMSDETNSAFVFVKPHANYPKVQEKVREML